MKEKSDHLTEKLREALKTYGSAVSWSHGAARMLRVFLHCLWNIVRHPSQDHRYIHMVRIQNEVNFHSFHYCTCGFLKPDFIRNDGAQDLAKKLGLE